MTGPELSLSEIWAMDALALNISQAARALGVERHTVSKGIADGTIPSVRVAARVLIPRLPFLALFGAAPTTEGETDEHSLPAA